MSALEALVSKRSATGVANLVASADAVSFYERIGYEDSGSLFLGKAVPRA